MVKKIFVTFLGTGLSPVAPGTMGSLAALPLIFFLHKFAPPEVYILFVTALFIFSVFVIDRYENETKTHDSSSIVIDEVLGMLIAFFLVPLNFFFVLLGFVLFRVLDILKPPPIRFLDKKVKGGFGVMVDDVVAGLLTNVALQVIYFQFFNSGF